MTDIASEFARLHPDDRRPFIAGVTLAYSAVFNALATAFAHPAGLTAAFQTIRGQYHEATTLFSVEGALE